MHKTVASGRAPGPPIEGRSLHGASGQDPQTGGCRNVHKNQKKIICMVNFDDFEENFGNFPEKLAKILEI